MTYAPDTRANRQAFADAYLKSLPAPASVAQPALPKLPPGGQIIDVSGRKYLQVNAGIRRSRRLLSDGELASLNDPGDSPTAQEAKEQAEREWDFYPAKRAAFSSRERFIAVRTAELTGQFRRVR